MILLNSTTPWPIIFIVLAKETYPATASRVERFDNGLSHPAGCARVAVRASDRTVARRRRVLREERASAPGREVLAMPRRRGTAQGGPAIDFAAEPLEGRRQWRRRGRRRPRGQPSHRGRPLRARAEDAARRESCRTARSRSSRAGSRWGCPGPRPRPTPATAAAENAGPRLTDAQRRFWAFQPVKAVAVPAVRDDVLGTVRRSTAFCWRPSRSTGWHRPRRPTGAPCSGGPPST